MVCIAFINFTWSILEYFVPNIKGNDIIKESYDDTSDKIDIKIDSLRLSITRRTF